MHSQGLSSTPTGIATLVSAEKWQSLNEKLLNFTAHELNQTVKCEKSLSKEVAKFAKY